MSMEILNKFFVTEKCEDLPISFKLDGEEFHGIPKEYDTKIETEENEKVKKTTFTGINAEGLEIKVIMTKYSDFPVVEYVTYLTNKGDKPTGIIDKLKGYDKEFFGYSPYFTYGNGDIRAVDGFEMQTRQVLGPIKVETKDGMGSLGGAPFMRLMTKEYGLNIAIGWPGDWFFLVTNESLPDKYALKCGQRRFRTRILPNETMRTPSITLMTFEGNEDVGRNLWRKFYFAHIIPKPLKPMVCLGFRDTECTEWSSTTEKHQFYALDKLKEMDIDFNLWWIDAGWYECNRKWYLTGTWKTNKENWPNGLGKLGERLENEGKEFLLWFEPERITQNSELWNDHPDWLLKKSDNEHAIINLGNKDCVEWLSERFTSIIKEAKATIYRQDLNKEPGPHWEWFDDTDREGSTENLHVQGYLKLWDNLIEKNPGLLIDTCAGGGRRNEMEALRRSVPLHYTDIAYGVHPVKQKQFRYMYEWIPYFRSMANDWRNENDEYQYFPPKEKGVNSFSLHNAIAPVIWPPIGPSSTKENLKLVKDFLVVWEKASRLLLKGDYYPLTECRGLTNDVYALQFDDTETKTGFIQVINNIDNEKSEFTFMPKLEENRNYIFEKADGNATLELKDNKLNVKIEKGCATIWFYKY